MVVGTPVGEPPQLARSLEVRVRGSGRAGSRRRRDAAARAAVAVRRAVEGSGMA
jgi:hypothetical protein